MDATKIQDDNRPVTMNERHQCVPMHTGLGCRTITQSTQQAEYGYEKFYLKYLYSFIKSLVKYKILLQNFHAKFARVTSTATNSQLGGHQSKLNEMEPQSKSEQAITFELDQTRFSLGRTSILIDSFLKMSS